MTTKLEQEFYNTFGIEPKWKDKRVKYAKTYYTEEQAQYLRETTKNRNIQLCYPEITAEKLLEMICIILNAEGLLTINTEGNIADIKDFVLRFLIGKVNKNNPYCHYKMKNKIKHQIQQLFKD